MKIKKLTALALVLCLLAGVPAAAAAGEETVMTPYKPIACHNPVMTQRFGADPWAMVYKDRVYLYMTGDEPMPGEDGRPRTNDYSNITTLRVLSSDDLVNWQDHGDIAAAGPDGAAQWAANSWAPCAAWKTVDGKDQFFLYFANSGGGIGVLTADSPVGPFTDPLGKPLISRSTPTCALVTWLFDPAVLVDADGTAYLYFGGGIPAGRQSAPGTARVVRLGGDMISLDGTPTAIDAPWLFEDSGINRFGDTYVYSYCSNFNVPAAGSEQGFKSGEIVYLTADSPMGPFRYGGRVLQNPGVYFGVGGNNHHCMFAFRGNWYITYHAATLDKDLGWNAGYRSTFVDVLRLNADGLPALSQGTRAGVAQTQPFDPYRPVPAATLATLAGAETCPSADGMDARAAAAGGWIAVAGVDFGAEGADCVTLRGQGRIEVLLDDPDGAPLAAADLKDRAQPVTVALSERAAGTHDLYFRFAQPGDTLAEWAFR